LCPNGGAIREGTAKQRYQEPNANSCVRVKVQASLRNVRRWMQNPQLGDDYQTY
jgi:hypothetical protein